MLSSNDVFRPWPHNNALFFPVNVGTPVVKVAYQQPLAISAKPGIGGSMKVEIAVEPPEYLDTNPSAILWQDWPLGTVTTQDRTTLSSPVTMVRWTALTANGIGGLTA